MRQRVWKFFHQLPKYYPDECGETVAKLTQSTMRHIPESKCEVSKHLLEIIILSDEKKDWAVKKIRQISAFKHQNRVVDMNKEIAELRTEYKTYRKIAAAANIPLNNLYNLFQPPSQHSQSNTHGDIEKE